MFGGHDECGGETIEKNGKKYKVFYDRFRHVYEEEVETQKVDLSGYTSKLQKYPIFFYTKLDFSTLWRLK